MKQITPCEFYLTIRFYAYDLPASKQKNKSFTINHLSHRPFMQPVGSCLHCQFLCRILKALFYQTSSEIKLFLQKKCKIFERWGLRLQTPKTAVPLQISGYAPGYNTSDFLRFCA